MLRKESAFGLDIGDASIKVMQISGRRTYALRGFAEIPLPAGIVVQGEIKEPGKLADYIKTAIKTARISGEYVVGALPESKTFIKVFSIARREPSFWRGAVEEELQKHIPYELSEVWWDAVVLSETPTTMTVLAGATPKTLVNAYIAAISAAGMTTIMLDLEALAIARAVFPSGVQQGCLLIVDLGATKSTILLAKSNAVVTTADGRSAAGALTSQIAQTLHIEIPEAEKMKLQHGLQEGPPEYAKIVEEYGRTLAARVSAVLSLSLTHDHCPAITEMILTGGGALLKGLPEALTKHLTIPTKLANPWVNTKGNFQKILSEGVALRYTTACGLALAAANYEHF